MNPQRRTPNSNWLLRGIYPEYTAWQRGNLCALSSVVQVQDEHLPLHWEWLISFSKMGKQRLTDQEVSLCLADLDAAEFEEDNHERGIARKFWLAVDHQHRKPCPCKDEVVIAEGEYLYSQKKTTQQPKDTE